MKALSYHITFLISILLFFSTTSYGQSSCDIENDYTTVCIGNPQTYPASTGGNTAHSTNSGNNYGCLSSTPNPAWFYFKADTGGSLIINQSNASNRDVDGALWGPFDSVSDIQTNCNSFPSPMACDYRSSPNFSFNVSVTAGKFYVLLVTNYSGSATNITLADGGSTATTDCNPDIQIKKTVNNATPNELSNVTWSISAENKGIIAATSVVVTDILPSNVTYVSHSGGSYSSSNGQWNIGNLSSGSTQTLTITSQVNSGTGGCSITNSVSNVTLDQTEIGAAIDDFNETIIVNDTTNPVTPTLADVTGECSVTAVFPTTTDGCGGINTITGTTSNALTYTTIGTHVITWNFDDGHGNSIDVNQNVIVTDVTSISTQPTNQTVLAGSNVLFSVIATVVDTYQWQVSTNGGVSFSAILDGSEYSGAQTSTLTVSNVDINKNGYVFRVRVSNSSNILCIPIVSNNANLIVNVGNVITNKKITYRVKKS